MGKSLFLLCCFLLHFLARAESSISAQQLLPRVYTDQIVNQTASCVLSSTNQVAFSWTDRVNTRPYYAIYDFNLQKTVQVQALSGVFPLQASRNVFCCYNSRDNQVFFTWTSLIPPPVPYYVVYDVNQKKIIQLDFLPGKFNAYPDVFCCYNSRDNQVFLSWTNEAPDRAVYYAIYDASQKKITDIETITTPGVDLKAFYDVYCCYNSLDNQIIFSWTDDEPGKAPYLAIYNANQKKIVKAEKISPSSSLQVHYDVFCCYNNLANQVIFSWASQGDKVPYFAVYDMAEQKIIQLQKVDPDYNLGVLNNVYCCYDTFRNQIVFSWIDDTNRQNPFYAVYDVSSSNLTTKATQFANYKNGAHGLGVFGSYNPNSQTVIFSWTSNLQGRNPWMSRPSADLLLNNMRKYSRVYPQQKCL